MLMALASTVAISVYFVLVAMTRGRLGDAAILYINYLAVRAESLGGPQPCKTRTHQRSLVMSGHVFRDVIQTVSRTDI